MAAVAAEDPRRSATQRRTASGAKTWTTAGGRTLTEADAARLADEFEAYGGDLSEATLVRVGRPSLSGPAGKGPSPRLSVRLPQDTYRGLQRRADAQNRRVTDLAREAIEAYLAAG